MAWSDKIKTGIEITMGDGKVFKPLYKLAAEKYDYNLAQFVFPEIRGTLVKRELAKGAEHTWDLFFQGEDHLEQIVDFKKSADDKRAWSVSHPFYGRLLVQPKSIATDPTGLSVTKLTVELIETILDSGLQIDVDPTNKIINDVLNLGDTLSESFAANVDPGPADILQMQRDTDAMYSLGSEQVLSGDQSDDYFNLYNTSLTKTLDAGDDALAAASALIDLVYFPAIFVSALRSRLNLMLFQFLALGEQLSDLIDPNSKSIYEMNAGAIVSAMVSASVNPIGMDYDTKGNVLDTISTIMDVYNQYIDNLDSLQTSNGGQPESYIPNYNSQAALNSLINFSISQLFNIATSSLTERSIILEADSNMIILAHRFYGPSGDDSNTDKFVAQNNIGRNEYLQIKKGRKLVYYT